MSSRKEQILRRLKIDKNFIEIFIKNDISKIEESKKSLALYRNELTEINDLIRKLDKQ